MFLKMLVGRFIGGGSYEAGDVVLIDDDRLAKRMIEAKEAVEDAGPASGNGDAHPVVFDGPTAPPLEARQAVAQALLAKGVAQETALAGGATMTDAAKAGAAASAASLSPGITPSGASTASMPGAAAGKGK